MTNAAMQLARSAQKTTEKRTETIRAIMKRKGRKMDKAVMFSSAKYYDTLKELASK